MVGVKAHLGWTILIVLGIIVALWVFSYVMITGGGGADEGEIIEGAALLL